MRKILFSFFIRVIDTAFRTEIQILRANVLSVFVVTDGEEAMRSLEAAQVKMEEKLNYMTNFIDQELQKVRENPV
jgi:hypothetical protein